MWRKTTKAIKQQIIPILKQNPTIIKIQIRKRLEKNDLIDWVHGTGADGEFRIIYKYCTNMRNKDG